MQVSGRHRPLRSPCSFLPLSFAFLVCFFKLFPHLISLLQLTLNGPQYVPHIFAYPSFRAGSLSFSFSSHFPLAWPCPPHLFPIPCACVLAPVPSSVSPPTHTHTSLYLRVSLAPSGSCPSLLACPSLAAHQDGLHLRVRVPRKRRPPHLTPPPPPRREARTRNEAWKLGRRRGRLSESPAA